ncbi:Crp/Fnr family transcriptional regulator [Mucilaginibacter aquatilis]|uniref:Cyclic nucleotide-binding domain-containing protein n=1 Tax=Mucilaginibacter aquatilis TaxID=1517760 RepID=A0A6I4I2Z4_9SPHI|nr:Crp/Fnr family transcriptional regulator [Mucilaginibacter aquatilis]MVN89502.1 cyclic nucleotide-binding domain-containing protein [Mucilaginibacter aquatilis]
MELSQIINSIYPLPQQSLSKLNLIAEEVTLPKGFLLINKERPNHNLFFIKQGIVRAYTYRGDSEVTFWFGTEGDTAISIKTYINHEPSYENIDLLEDCTLYKIDSRKLKMLYDEDIHIANWGRKFVELEYLRTEQRLISMQFLSAAQRYDELLKHNRQLVQRVPLGYIASYLGISQVSLSRIRAGR